MRTLIGFLAIAVAGCATVRQPDFGEPVPEPAPPVPAPAARTENLAIAGLLDGARTDAAAGGPACSTGARAQKMETKTMKDKRHIAPLAQPRFTKKPETLGVHPLI